MQLDVHQVGPRIDVVEIEDDLLLFVHALNLPHPGGGINLAARPLKGGPASVSEYRGLT